MAQLEQERVVGRLLWEGVGLGEELAGDIPEEEHAVHEDVLADYWRTKKGSKLTCCWWYCAMVLVNSGSFQAG